MGRITSIYRLLEEQAGERPESIALLAPGRRPMTYGRLLAQAEEVTGMLNSAGISRGDRVAVVLSNGPEMAACFLSVAAGAVCAPLNPAYRASEFEFYLSDLKPKVLLVETGSDSPAVRVARSLGIKVIELTPLLEQEAGVFRLSAGAAPMFCGFGDVALVLYTSGTTSRPKMVPLTHENLCRSAGNIQRALELCAADRCLNVMPLFHIHGLVGAVLSSMAAGASVVCTPGFYAPRFFEWLEEYRPTWYTAVPTIHSAILDRAEGKREIIERCPLRLIRSCSAALPPRLMENLEEVFGAPVIESYGMTEASHQMASNPLPPGKRKAGSVGVAAGPEIAIMDEEGRLVEAGRTGEIVIRGANVTRGYENNPEANESAFKGGWFRTGDQGWMDDERYLYVTGRTKEIINRAGEKVSPREVDEALLEHPAVRQAVTFALPDAGLGEDVAAAVVLREDASATQRELREFAAKRLADFKVPSRVIFLKEIPKVPTGKIQRIGLAERLGVTESGTRTGDAVRPFVAPSTPKQELLCRIWSEVLRVERIGIHDNFFHLGGDSILAAQVLSRVRLFAGAGLSMITFFENPTVAAMAECLESAQPEAPGAEAPSLRAVQKSGELPLSFAQERIWFLTQYEEDSAIYNRPAALRLEGPLNPDALQASLTEIVRRHEVLRSTFHEREGSPVYIVSPVLRVVVPVHDLSSLPEAERDDRVRRLALEEARRQFDMARDQTLRATLLKLGEGQHVLLLTMHHITSDGWSTSVLFRELEALYNAFDEGKPSPLPELPIQFADFARWQREWLNDEVLSEQLAWWEQKLSGCPSFLQLPTDRPRPALQTYRGSREIRILPRELSDSLRRVCRQEGVTIFTVLLAALQTLLHRYSGGNDIVTGSPVANRTRLETEPLIGPFVNTMALRTDFSGNPTFRQLLARVRESVLGAQAHQDLPFEKLVRALQPERSLSYSPVFQVLFQLRNIPREGPCLRNLKTEELDFNPGFVDFDLVLDIAEKSEGLRCVLGYNTDLFEPATAERLLAHFQVLLEAMVANPGERISRLPLLTRQERHQLLTGWNNTEAEYPRGLCIHELFESQVEKTPDAVAVVCEDRQLTYRELNVLANRLAHRLCSLGVGPEMAVGLHAERSLEMVAGILAIWKAGGVYVPLDPSYPRERLEFMGQDAGVQVLLTQASLPDRLHAPQVLCLDTFRQPADGADSDNVTGKAQPGNLAYIAYTSGSTGKPKGVMIAHEGAVNYLHFLGQAYGLNGSDVILPLTSISFDASVRELVGGLLAGARTVLISGEETRDPQALLRRTSQQRVTCLLAVVPSLLRELTLAGRERGVLLQSVRLILTTGETLLFSDCRRAQEVFTGGALMVNQYGPTEGTMIASYYRVPAAMTGEGPVPIGKPIPNCRLYILDEERNPVPMGVPGELYIGGVGVARGYRNRPDLDASSFFPDPFGDGSVSRLYRTGDLARYLPDGNIEFRGRRDMYVKIRGCRIELGEVEAVLREHPAVHEAVVLEAAGASGDTSIIAYLTSGPNAPPSARELRDFLRRKLPDYMVPARFLTMEVLPKLPNGKVDREALPKPDASRPQTGTVFMAPRTSLEKVVAGIWAEILGVDRVGISDDFFELGGHSLLATRVMSRLREAFQMDTPLRVMFKAPTVAGLAAYLLRDPETRRRVERTAELMLLLAELSDEEAEKMLAERSSFHQGASSQ